MYPSAWPSIADSIAPTMTHTNSPTIYPSLFPSLRPSHAPSVLPTVLGTFGPSIHISLRPSLNPTGEPSTEPSFHPSTGPSLRPSTEPSFHPSIGPSLRPSTGPSFRPSTEPSFRQSKSPSLKPSLLHSNLPTNQPSFIPTALPSLAHTNDPSNKPTSFLRPSSRPSFNPTPSPSFYPSFNPIPSPSALPTELPSENATNIPSSTQTTNAFALAGVAAASAGAAAAASSSSVMNDDMQRSRSAPSEIEGGFRNENENSNNQITSAPDDVAEDANKSKKRLQSYREKSKRFRQEETVESDNFNEEDNDMECGGSVISDGDDNKGRNEQHHSSKVTHTSTHFTSHDIPVPIVAVQHQKRWHWLSDLLEEHDEQHTSISSLSSGRRTGSVRLQRKLRSTRNRETSLDVYSNVRRQLSKIVGEDSVNPNIDSKCSSLQDEIISNEYVRNTRVSDQSIKPRVIYLEKEHVENPNVHDRNSSSRISEGYSIIE